MTHHPGWKRLQGRLSLLVMATLGGALGLAVRAQRAHACSCASPQWGLQLESATSSDQAVDHTQFWPKEATLDAFAGHAQIFGVDDAPGAVDSLEALR